MVSDAVIIANATTSLMDFRLAYLNVTLAQPQWTPMQPQWTPIQTQWTLRSSSPLLLYETTFQTVTGRSFRYVSAKTWNDLLETTRTIDASRIVLTSDEKYVIHTVTLYSACLDRFPVSASANNLATSLRRVTN